MRLALILIGGAFGFFMAVIGYPINTAEYWIGMLLLGAFGVASALLVMKKAGI